MSRATADRIKPSARDMTVIRFLRDGYVITYQGTGSRGPGYVIKPSVIGNPIARLTDSDMQRLIDKGYVVRMPLSSEAKGKWILEAWRAGDGIGGY